MRGVTIGGVTVMAVWVRALVEHVCLMCMCAWVEYVSAFELTQKIDNEPACWPERRNPRDWISNQLQPIPYLFHNEAFQISFLDIFYSESELVTFMDSMSIFQLHLTKILSFRCWVPMFFIYWLIKFICSTFSFLF